MFGSAAGFALLAAISPAAILVCATYLGSASPRRTTLWFLASAIIMTAVIGVIALASAAALATVVIISVMFIWLPFAFHLVRPEATARRLKAFNGWLRAHGHALVAGALLAAGVLLISDGISGLA